MKKMLLMGIVFLGIFATVQAQDSPLKEYLGKYTFAEGSPVTEVVLTIQDCPIHLFSFRVLILYLTR